MPTSETSSPASQLRHSAESLFAAEIALITQIEATKGAGQ